MRTPYFFPSLLIIGCFFLLISCSKELETENAQLKTRLDSALVEMRGLRQENARLTEATGEQIQVGFEVQIGAFEYFDLDAYADELVRFREIDAGGLKKYVLGRFRTFEDAEAFLQDIRSIGLKDSFIAGVVDGKRSSVAEAKAAAKEYYGDF